MSIEQLSNFLSLITIALCFVLKLPQIINLLKVQCADEISILGLTLELSSYTITACYNYTNGYSLIYYFEYPIILVQEYFLIYLVLKYLDKFNLFALLAVTTYILISACFMFEAIPKLVLTILLPLQTPISASSKVIQLVSILKAKNARAVSPLTWFLSAFTNMTRMFTILMDSADTLILGNLTISTLLSLSVMFSAIYYKYRPKKRA